MSKKVYFNDSKGVKLCGVLSDNKEDFSTPIMILCHGFTTSKDNSTNTKLEEILNIKNIATFRFDFFGHGESEGNFSEITISKAVDSIIQAIKYIKRLGYHNIGLFGSSFGGMSSIMTASQVKDLSLLVLKSPVSDYLEVEEMRRSQKDIDEWQKKGYVVHKNSKGEEKKLNYSFFEDISNNNGYEAAENINTRTLIIHGDHDDIVPLAQSKKLSQIIKFCELKIVSGAGHKYINPGEFDEMINIAQIFITKGFSNIKH
jgi:uncharacterized protein